MALLSTFGGIFEKSAIEELSIMSRSQQRKWLFQQKKTSSNSVQPFLLPIPWLVISCLVSCPQGFSVLLVQRIVRQSTTVCFFLSCWLFKNSANILPSIQKKKLQLKHTCPRLPKLPIIVPRHKLYFLKVQMSSNMKEKLEMRTFKLYEFSYFPFALLIS